MEDLTEGPFCLLMVFLIVIGALVFIAVALWPEHEQLAWIAVLLMVACVATWIKKQWNEMDLRHVRYRHQTETPLNHWGRPTHLQAGEHEYRQDNQEQE
jgi:hypothetical protein